MGERWWGCLGNVGFLAPGLAARLGLHQGLGGLCFIAGKRAAFTIVGLCSGPVCETLGGMRPAVGLFLCLLWLKPGVSLFAAVQNWTVVHAPAEPKSGQTVRISVSGKLFEGASPLALQYQVLEPGKYVERQEKAYQENWISMPLRRDSGGVGSYIADLPGALQKHRSLIRYRVVSGERLIAPPAEDARGNFAYFVYDGVPAWKGAIHPTSADPKLSKVVGFSPELMAGVQIYHFIAKKSSVENTTWYQASNVFDESSRHRYSYTGTIVANGKVYDHVRFRARGGEWRHAMGKNMWKFDFPRGHHLAAKDDFARPCKTKWEKLNLGACIQQGNYMSRGEHGLFEAATYRLFNLAGVPAPKTHYVHLRIIDDREEAPSNQYEGDFWGLYLATEEIDENFLEEHDLPKGNIYKWDFGRPKPEYVAPGAASNRQDVLAFVTGYSQQPTEEWWRTHADLERYFSYRSIVECVHHYDIAFGKNYFYYFNPKAERWIVLPWDVDLTWKNEMYGTGQEPFYRAGVLRNSRFITEYQNRLREIRDLLYNPKETGALLDELAAVISTPENGRSLVEADRMRWDYHPVMASQWVNARKAGQGKFYELSATGDFAGMVKWMKEYVVNRGEWCDRTLLGGGPIPGTPKVKAESSKGGGSGPMKVRAELPPDAAAVAGYEWRLAEVSAGSLPKTRRPRLYEIEALWEQDGGEVIEVPARFFGAGRAYRVRARAKDSTGRCGHWSEPLEFTAGK